MFLEFLGRFVIGGIFLAILFTFTAETMMVVIGAFIVLGIWSFISSGFSFSNNKDDDSKWRMIDGRGKPQSYLP